MTFKLEGFVSKLESPIIVKTDDDEMYFESGADLALHDFDKRFSIKSLFAKDDKIVIELVETGIKEPFNYSGEAALS